MSSSIVRFSMFAGAGLASIVSVTPVAAQLATPATLEAALKGAAVGEVLDLGLPASLNTALILNQGAAKLADAGGSLLYSDCPETARGYGILYRDTLPAGENRIYLYHVNGVIPSVATRFSTVLTNDTQESTTVTITRKSFPTPTGDYLGAGRTGVRLYYENTTLPPPITLEPGASALLDPALDSRMVGTDQLVNATYDYTSTQPLRVTTLMVPSGADTVGNLPNWTMAENDEFLRQGTFPRNSRETTTPIPYKTSDGIKRLRFADGGPLNIDTAITGTDAETSAATTLRGNYAVTYNVRLDVRADDTRRLALLLNPRAGAYGGYFRTTFPAATGTPQGNLVPSPLATVSVNTKGAVIGLLTPGTGAQTLLIEFIPAGATSLPFEILLVPFSDPKPTGIVTQ